MDRTSNSKSKERKNRWEKLLLCNFYAGRGNYNQSSGALCIQGFYGDNCVLFVQCNISCHNKLPFTQSVDQWLTAVQLDKVK